MSRRGPLVATVAGLAAALLVVFGLIVPKISQARASQTKLDQARQQQSVLELRLQELQATEAQAQKLRAQLTKLQAAVPPTVDLPGLIRLLNDVATQSGVNFIAITPGQPTQSVASGLAQPAPVVSPTSLPTGGISSGSSVGISIVPVTITINGDFFAVDQYLFRLEVLPRISKVLSISLAPGRDRLPARPRSRPAPLRRQPSRRSSSSAAATPSRRCSARRRRPARRARPRPRPARRTRPRHRPARRRPRRPAPAARTRPRPSSAGTPCRSTTCSERRMERRRPRSRSTGPCTR